MCTSNYQLVDVVCIHRSFVSFSSCSTSFDPFIIYFFLLSLLLSCQFLIDSFQLSLLTRSCRIALCGLAVWDCNVTLGPICFDDNIPTLYKEMESCTGRIFLVNINTLFLPYFCYARLPVILPLQHLFG